MSLQQNRQRRNKFIEDTLLLMVREDGFLSLEVVLSVDCEGSAIFLLLQSVKGAPYVGRKG
jgi:hypothetical protein